MNNRLELFKQVLSEMYPGRYAVTDCAHYIKVKTAAQPEGIYKGSDIIFRPVEIVTLAEALKLAALIAVENSDPYFLIS